MRPHSNAKPHPAPPGDPARNPKRSTNNQATRSGQSAFKVPFASVPKHECRITNAESRMPNSATRNTPRCFAQAKQAQPANPVRNPQKSSPKLDQDHHAHAERKPQPTQNPRHPRAFFCAHIATHLPKPKAHPHRPQLPQKQRSQRTRASFSVRLTYAVVTSLLLATNSRALCVYFFSAAVRPSHLSQILPNSSALSLVMMSTCARTVVLAGFSPYAALLSSMRTLS